MNAQVTVYIGHSPFVADLTAAHCHAHGYCCIGWCAIRAERE